MKGLGWRILIWSLLKRVLFRLDAEKAHRLTVGAIRLGSGMGGLPLRIVSGFDPSKLLVQQPPEVFGMSFASRVGLAAGFDKDAELIQSLPLLGFGFAEIGTVTPRPQPGNPIPRLFRDPAQSAVFNRMGFNGAGARVVAERLARSKPGLPPHFRVGVNIGKNKDTTLEDASKDYLAAIQPFRGLADYVVINVSSPNTPGLRSLQTVEALKPIVEKVHGEISAWGGKPPLLLKLAPEIQGGELSELLIQLQSLGIDGWILTNTLAGHWVLNGNERLPGGWSGGPLKDAALQRLREARHATRLPIISVGGILSAEDAKIRRDAGADLVQIYSGWIFNGPGFPAQIAKTI